MRAKFDPQGRSTGDTKIARETMAMTLATIK